MGEIGDLGDTEEPSETTDAGATTEDNGTTQVPDTTLEPVTTAGNSSDTSRHQLTPVVLTFNGCVFCNFVSCHLSSDSSKEQDTVS